MAIKKYRMKKTLDTSALLLTTKAGDTQSIWISKDFGEVTAYAASPAFIDVIDSAFKVFTDKAQEEGYRAINLTLNLTPPTKTFKYLAYVGEFEDIAIKNEGKEKDLLTEGVCASVTYRKSKGLGFVGKEHRYYMHIKKTDFYPVFQHIWLGLRDHIGLKKKEDVQLAVGVFIDI